MYKIIRMVRPSYLKELQGEYKYTRPVRGDIEELKVPFMGPGRGILHFQVRSYHAVILFGKMNI